MRKLIAKTCGMPAGRVTIAKGAKGRDKLLRLQGLGTSGAARLLGRGSDGEG